MTNAIKHRGPDGEGYLLVDETGAIPAFGDDTSQDVVNTDYDFSPHKHISETEKDAFLVFGHRRLSIIDLSPGGHQPMCVRGKKIWVTYNGEIYNYTELREELQAKGYHFVTNSDTEIVANSYLEWGKECLERFNGMWAFVIYDEEKKELFGARDRFGVKPLYYYLDQAIFAFASEQKALLKMQGINSGINPVAAFDFFLKNTMEHEEEGMFRNILELFPSYAFSLTLDNRNFRKWKYYSLPVNDNDEIFSEEKLTNSILKTKELFLRAISLRLRSDVAIGSALSGGIDSSAIVGAIETLRIKNGSANKIKLYTACFNEPEIDESNYAKLVAEQVKGEWYKVYPSSTELLNDLSDFTYCQDLPIWSTSGYAQYRVMKAVKESGVKVILDGQGGDELFAGYYPYHFRYWTDLLKSGRVKDFYSEINSFPSSGKFIVSQFAKQYGRSLIPSRTIPLIYKNYFHDLRYLKPVFWKEYKDRIAVKETIPASLNQLLAKEMYNFRLKAYLKCGDRSSMWHSVESRTPFSDDKDLIEYVFSLPAGMKIRNSVNKYILRESIKGSVPDKIRERKDKKGFLTPNNRWIPAIKDQVRDIFKEHDEYLNVPLLMKEYDTFFGSASRPDNNRIFRYISFAKWREVFKV